MKIIVQKFGGTSLKTDKDRRRAAERVKKASDEGFKVVVVVSAMGRSGDPYATDTLLNLTDRRFISDREADLLMSCGETLSSVVFSSLLKASGLQSEAFTGGQAGFRTSEHFGEARIQEMRTNLLKKRLAHIDVAVVAGFQGQSKTGEMTTIGRGGSDTSAAALGASLGAEWVDIFTDVEGIMTADPRLVTEARQLSVLTYTEVVNLAYQGAKVIHPRAVEIAMNAKIPLRIRSTHSDGPGTLVTAVKKAGQGQDVQEHTITGITYVDEVTQIKVKADKGQFDFQRLVFKAMADRHISVDFFNISPREVVYTVNQAKTAEAELALKELGFETEITLHCAKVSAVGAGIAGVPGVMSKIVQALMSRGIKILQSADSHTTIWVLIPNEYLAEAVSALHRTFELEKINNEVTNGGKGYEQ